MKTFLHPLRSALLAALLIPAATSAWAVVTNTPPVVTLTGANPRTFEAAATYTDLGATATDAEDGARTPVITSNTVVSNVPGAYSVTWTATDTGGLTGTATRTVNVVDTTPPVLATHADVTVVATSSAGAVVNYAAGSATDIVTASPTLSYSQDSGTKFPIGTTVVTITAKDAANNTSTTTFNVIVTGTGVFDFSSATPSYNPVNELALPKLVQLQINRPAPAYGAVTVKAVPSQPATVPTGFSKYTYGTDYAFVSGTSAGTTVSFADGQTSATVDVQLKSTVLSKKGVFVLTLTTPTGGASLGTTTVATVTIKARDLTKPVITLTSPDTSTTNVVGASVDVVGKVNENDALFSFTVKLNGADQTLTANPLTSFVAGTDMSFSALATAPENQTNNTLTIEALDISGNKTTVTKTLSYTNNRPALAGTYNALLTPATTPDFTNTGLVSVTVANSGLFSGTVALGGVSVPVSGTILNSGVARFKPDLGNAFDLVDSSTEYDSYLGALAFALNTATPAMTGAISTKSSGGSLVAGFTAKLAPYKAVTNVIPSNSGLLNRPNSAPFTKGVYTVSLPAKTQSPVLSTALYPQGTGFATLTLTNAGDATFTGYTADGAAFTYASKLRSDNSVPLYIPLYGNRGALIGEVTFDPNQTNTDISGSDLLWLRPALTRAVYYNAGWAGGIRVDLVGTKHKSPASLNYGQGADDLTDGNSTLTFTDGLLASTVTKNVNVSTANGAVTITPATLAGYTFALVPTAGTFSGTVKVSGENRAFKGILLSKGTNTGGVGYFLSPPPLVYGSSGESGKVTLTPAGP